MQWLQSLACICFHGLSSSSGAKTPFRDIFPAWTSLIVFSLCDRHSVTTPLCHSDLGRSCCNTDSLACVGVTLQRRRHHSNNLMASLLFFVFSLFCSLPSTQTLRLVLNVPLKQKPLVMLLVCFCFQSAFSCRTELFPANLRRWLLLLVGW